MSILDQEKPMGAAPIASFWSGSPKTMFFMGLFMGLAVTSTVALAVVLGFVWNGKSFGSGSGAPAAIAAAPTPTPTPTDPNAAAPTPAAGPVKDVTATDHITGAKNAKVTMIEYSDFECPFCKQHFASVEQALKDFPNDVRLVYRHYPLSFHQNAQKEAEASECVAKLGGNDAFWKFHNLIFTQTTSNGTGFALTALGPAAKSVGVDQTKFQTCLDSGEMAGLVNGEEADGNAAGVQGTPATFINGKMVEGAVPYSQFKAALVAAGAKG